VYHRDVKSDNCLLDHTHIMCKITDFGLASLPGVGNATACVGTLRYMAPELTAEAGATAEERASRARVHLADRADVYAFGLLLYELVHETRAFRTLTGAEALAAAQMGERPPLVGMRTTPHLAPLAELIRRCWAVRPADRPCMADVLTELERVSAPSSAVPSTSATCDDSVSYGYYEPGEHHTAKFAGDHHTAKFAGSAMVGVLMGEPSAGLKNEAGPDVTCSGMAGPKDA
jgi:serine/threonine-protein kinase